MIDIECTYEEFSRTAPFDVRTIYKYVRGRGNPRLSDLIKIMDTFWELGLPDLSVDYLLGLTEIRRMRTLKK